MRSGRWKSRTISPYPPVFPARLAARQRATRAGAGCLALLLESAPASAGASLGSIQTGVARVRFALQVLFQCNQQRYRLIVPQDDRHYRICRLLSDYVRSPSLRHLRDPHSLQRLAGEIVKEVASPHPIWTKWSQDREALARPAAYCWIPVEDLRDHLDRMPGPRLTLTDVVQRLRAFNEEAYEPYPDEEQKDACLEIYNREQSAGTDMPAIVGAIQQFVEEDREARRTAQQEAYRAQVEADRLAAEERLLSGADCKWTALGKSKTFHCRVNGRVFRLEPQPDKKFHLSRVKEVDDQNGDLVGRYAGRTEATRVVADIAYKPEPAGVDSTGAARV